MAFSINDQSPRILGVQLKQLQSETRLLGHRVAFILFHRGGAAVFPSCTVVCFNYTPGAAGLSLSACSRSERIARPVSYKSEDGTVYHDFVSQTELLDNNNLLYIYCLF